MCELSQRVKPLKPFKNQILEEIATVLKTSRFLKEEDLSLLNQTESESKIAQSCLTLCRPPIAYQASPSMRFSRQEYWSGLPFPSPEDLPDPGIEPQSPSL